MQTRSGKELKSAAEYIRSGKVGDIHIVRVFNLLYITSTPLKGPEIPVPEGFDYDMWCGPAPKLPYRAGRWWVDLWDFSSGRITDDVNRSVAQLGSKAIHPQADRSSHIFPFYVHEPGRRCAMTWQPHSDDPVALTMERLSQRSETVGRIRHTVQQKNSTERRIGRQLKTSVPVWPALFGISRAA